MNHTCSINHSWSRVFLSFVFITFITVEIPPSVLFLFTLLHLKPSSHTRCSDSTGREHSNICCFEPSMSIWETVRLGLLGLIDSTTCDYSPFWPLDRIWHRDAFRCRFVCATKETIHKLRPCLVPEDSQPETQIETYCEAKRLQTHSPASGLLWKTFIAAWIIFISLQKRPV